MFLITPFYLGFVVCISGIETVRVCCGESGVEAAGCDFVTFFICEFEIVFVFGFTHSWGPAGVVDWLGGGVEELDVHFCDGGWHGEGGEDGWF